MRIGSGLSQISNNLYVQPRYPEAPIEAVKKVSPRSPGAINNLGNLGTMSAINQRAVSGNVILTMPDGGILVGRFIDVLA